MSYISANSQRELEAQKAEYARILEMIKTGDPDKAAENLRFFIDVGLIADPALKSKVKEFLLKREPGSGPALPLGGVVFARANLAGAEFVGANLLFADLRGANLQGTNLQGAHLEGAYLRGAVGLTQEQLDMASGNDGTILPDGLARPAHWSAAAPD